jgi:hypothetical protein
MKTVGGWGFASDPLANIPAFCASSLFDTLCRPWMSLQVNYNTATCHLKNCYDFSHSEVITDEHPLTGVLHYRRYQKVESLI